MKKKTNKKKLKKAILSIISVILVLTIAAVTVAFIANYPDKRDPIFPLRRLRRQLSPGRAFSKGYFINRRSVKAVVLKKYVAYIHLTKRGKPTGFIE